MVSALSSVVWLRPLLGDTLGVVIWVISALAAVGIAFAFIKSALSAFNETKPALVVDSRGIADRFHYKAFIPWSNIKSASLDFGDGDHLTIKLKDGARFLDGTIVKRTLWRRLSHVFSGGDLSIPLSTIKYDHQTLRRALNTNLDRSKQAAQSAEINPG